MVPKLAAGTSRDNANGLACGIVGRSGGMVLGPKEHGKIPELVSHGVNSPHTYKGSFFLYLQ